MKNIKVLLSIVLAFSMVTGMIFFNAGKAEAKQALSPLHVEGVALADKNGKTVQLRGLSHHGIAWFPQYVNKDFYKQMHKDWGCNVVRAAMYTEEYNGYCTGGKKENRKLVKKPSNTPRTTTCM